MPVAKTPVAPEGQLIVIEGNLAKIQHTVVERQVRTSDLLDELVKSAPLLSGLLPRGCIAYARSSSQESQLVSLYLIERPAGLVTVRFKDATSNQRQTEENITELTLSWPHTYWLVKFAAVAITDLYIVCTKAPLNSLDDEIFVLPMPNIYSDGHGAMCLGNLVVPESSTPAARAEKLIEIVLSSLWNQDLPPYLEGLGFESLTQWAEASTANKDFGLSLNYHPHRHKNLTALLDSLLGGSE